MNVSRIVRNTIVTLCFVSLLLAYFFATVSSMGAGHRYGPYYQIHSFWHVVTALSVLIGSMGLSLWGWVITQDCQAILRSSSAFPNNQQSTRIQKQAMRACLLAGAFQWTFLLGMLNGFLIIFKIPASMTVWYKTAHQQLSSIQGPALLVAVWVFYVVYVLLLRRAANFSKPSK